MGKTVVLYLHVHQPFRIKPYSIFRAGVDHMYFNDQTIGKDTNNEFIIRKVAEKSYLPTNAILQELLERHEQFKLSLSLPGTVIEQFENWAPDVLDSFKRLVDTGRVEILAETYHHTLAFFYDRQEFEEQVKLHREKIEQVFDVTPTSFRNTELAYNNDLAYWADQAGYKAIITEGWDPILGWRSPNYVYRPSYTDNIRLLLKNYKLSDDVAFRFSDTDWKEYPLTAEKYVHWIDAGTAEEEIVNLFMDYETFGEHQWDHSGIFDFLKHFPSEFLQHEGNNFATITEAAEHFEAKDFIDVPHIVTWADTERDLTAWTGNAMQHQALSTIYEMKKPVLASNDQDIIEDWRKLQASDHFYYMCTKWFNDGDVHAYFSPYDSPYEAFIHYMNVMHDLRFRLSEEGLDV
jgi:alpha-amylase